MVQALTSTYPWCKHICIIDINYVINYQWNLFLSGLNITAILIDTNGVFLLMKPIHVEHIILNFTAYHCTCIVKLQSPLLSVIILNIVKLTGIHWSLSIHAWANALTLDSERIPYGDRNFSVSSMCERIFINLSLFNTDRSREPSWCVPLQMNEIWQRNEKQSYLYMCVSQWTRQQFTLITVWMNSRGRKLLSMCSEYDSNLIVVKLISVFFLSYTIAW